MYYFSSFAIGGFVPSAAIAGVLLLVGLGAFFYLGIKGPTIKVMVVPTMLKGNFTTNHL